MFDNLIVYELSFRDGRTLFEMGRTEDDILADMQTESFEHVMDARPVDMKYIRYLFNPNRIMEAYAVVNQPDGPGVFLLGEPDRNH